MRPEITGSRRHLLAKAEEKFRGRWRADLASKAKQLPRSALTEKGVRDSRAHKFVARSACGV